MRYQGLAFIIIILIVGATGILFMEKYPAAFVTVSPSLGSEAEIIWTNDAHRMAQGVMVYYRQTLGNATSTVDLPEGTEREALSKSIDALIRNTIMARAIDTEGLRAKTDTLLAERMAEYAKQPEFSVAMAMLYGLDTDSFLEFIARPETEREVLKTEKGLDDAALASWLDTLERESRIVRFVK